VAVAGADHPVGQVEAASVQLRHLLDLVALEIIPSVGAQRLEECVEGNPTDWVER
jgi:hypothetical protein